MNKNVACFEASNSDIFDKTQVTFPQINYEVRANCSKSPERSKALQFGAIIYVTHV